MKLGISNYSFSKYQRATGCSMKDICDLTKKIGFDVIDFTQNAAMDATIAENPIATAKELRAYCAELGLEIGAYTVGANFFKAVEDEAFAEQLLDELFRQVDFAEALGVHKMRHDLGYSLPEGTDWRPIVEKMAPMVRKVTDYAASKGIATCSENHGLFFQEPERMEAMFAAVGSDNYGWLVDIGNFMCADVDPIEGVRHAIPYVKHAHVKDFLYFKPEELEITPEGGFFKNRYGNLLRGTVLGHGVVPVIECIRMLRKGGYDDVFTLEFEGAEENLPAIEASYAYMRKIQAYLEEKN